MRTVVTIALCLAAIVAFAQASREPRPGEDKLVGFVKGKPARESFVLAVPRKGEIRIDASRATVRRKDGRTFRVADLVGGSSVSAFGKLEGKRLVATRVIVNSVRGERKR
jgi:hypothetical protein